MVKNAAARYPHDPDKHKPAAGHASTQRSQHFIRTSADDIILSLANAHENKRARQVSEWERVQASRWQQAA